MLGKPHVMALDIAVDSAARTEAFCYGANIENSRPKPPKSENGNHNEQQKPRRGANGIAFGMYMPRQGGDKSDHAGNRLTSMR